MKMYVVASLVISAVLVVLLLSILPTNSQSSDNSLISTYTPRPTNKPLFSPSPTPTAKLFAADEEIILKYVQDWRSTKELPTLVENETLCQFASTRVVEIQQDFSHSGYKKKSMDIGLQAGFTKIGENLAGNQINNESYIQQWLQSPSHKANLEYPYTQTCLKCSGTYCVQLFAKY